MLKIRLARIGSKNQPKYRIVVIPQERKRNGKYIEKLGSYDETVKPAKIEFNKDRLLYWVGVGAQITPAVKRLVK